MKMYRNPSLTEGTNPMAHEGGASAPPSTLSFAGCYKPVHLTAVDVMRTVKATGQQLTAQYGRKFQGGQQPQTERNRVVLRYLSPRSGRMTTMVPESICLATSRAPATAAPLDMPTKRPSMVAS